MGSSWIGVFLVLAFAVAFHLFLSQAARDRWIPVVFAFVLWSEATGRFFAGGSLYYYSLFLFTFLCYAFLLSDLRQLELRRCPALKTFLPFYAWFMIAAFFGDNTILAEKMAVIQLRIVLCGFAAMAWGLRRPENMERLFRWAALATALCAVQYARYGSWSAADLADAGGRLVVDEMTTGIESNVNGISTTVSAIIGFPMIYLMHRWNWKREKLVKTAAVGALLVLGLVLVRTGSRNGGLAIFALLGYFVFGKTNIKKYQKVLLLVLVGVAMAFALDRFVGDVELRVFQFVTQEESSRGNYGSGRSEFYKRIYEEMTPVQRIVGAGAPTELLDSNWHISNRHSMYMQVLNQAGFIGVFLMLVFIVHAAFVLRRRGALGAMGLLLLSIWVLTGVGEAANMTGGCCNYGLGVALALCNFMRLKTKNIGTRVFLPPNRVASHLSAAGGNSE